MPNKVYFPLSLALSLYILIFAVLHLNTAMDWDELDVGSKLANREYKISYTPKEERGQGVRVANVIDPRKHIRNHFISTVSSLLAIDLFGVSKLTLRLPAILFTAALLGLLIFSHTLLSKPTVVFSLAHLAVNSLNLWYTHSMRGYIAMVFFTCALYLLAFKWFQKGHLGKGQTLLFYSLFFITPLTHPFGGIFSLILLGTLLILTTMSNTPREEKIKKFTFLFPGFFVVPFTAYFFFYGMKFISRVGFLLSKDSPELSEPLLSLFGIPDRISLTILALFFVAVLALSLMKKQFRNFHFVFVVLSWGFVVVSLSILKPSFFEPRFLLSFLLPTLFWVGSVPFRLRGDYKLKWITAAAILIVLPGLKQKDHPDSVNQWVITYDDFLKGARRHIPAGKNCFLITGDFDQVYFSKSLFFKNPEQCSSYYQIHFGRNWEGEIALEKDPRFDYRLEYDDGESNRLFRLTLQPPHPVYSS